MKENPNPTGGPRICCCVLMNHPFPANLPLLRLLYRDRFSHLRFLIPFERLEDEDVITVYRGSYAHAAYLTDAWHELQTIECDYFLVVHDDVLLNPQFDEESFTSLFGLAPDEAFIPRVQSMPNELGRWIWYMSFLPRLLYPKSLLFGSGIERANLAKYLPSPDLLRERMEAAGVKLTDHVFADAEKMEDVARHPSRVLLHGLAEPLASDSSQSRVDERSFNLEQRFVRLLQDAHGLSAETTDNALARIDLPFPIVHSGYCTDFYILPRSGAAEFCHYMGVAAAAGLFVEIIAPTLLHAVSKRVLTAVDKQLDFSGFDQSRGIDSFVDPRAIAIHPFKLSAFHVPERSAALLTILQSIGAGQAVSNDTWLAAGLRPSIGFEALNGWNPPEDWGRWAGAEEATILTYPRGAEAIRLHLRAPTHPQAATFRGRVSVSGLNPIAVEVTWPETSTIVILPLSPTDDAALEITLGAERLVRPQQVDPNSSDDRALGLGIVGVEAIGAVNAGR